MANSDGQVRIDMITNAKEVLKDMNSLNKVFDKNADTMKKATSATSAYEEVVNNNIKVLRDAALGGNQNTEAFKELAAKTREYKKALDDANSAVEKAIGVNNGLSGTVKGLIGSFIGLQTVRVVSGYIMDSVSAFREEDRAIKALNQSLANAGVYSEAYSREIQDLAAQIQQTTNYGNEAVIKAQALGQAYAGNVKITKDLTLATIDFAAATGMDLESAFTLVGKSIGSSTNALGRYGVQLGKNMSDSQKAESITNQLGAAFSGQAKNMADAAQHLNNELQEVAKAIGRVFNPAIEEGQNKLAGFANVATKTVNVIGGVQRKLYELKRDTALRHVEVGKMYGWDTSAFQKQADKYQKYIDTINNKNVPTTTGKTFKINDDFGFSGSGTTASVEKAKDAYEKLQESVAKAKREIELAAIAHGTASTEVQNAFIKYNQLNTQLSEVNSLFNKEQKNITASTSAYNQLNEQIGKIKEQLLQMYLTGQGGTTAFTALKNQLVTLQTQVQNANTAINSKVGIDWANTANSIKSQLSSALLTPLQQGESAFERFGNLALSIVQQIGQQLLNNLIIEPAINKITTAFQSLASATPLQSVTQALTNTGQVAAQTATSMTTLATSQTAASAIMSSTSGVLASSAATYMSSAVAAKQLAAAITQAAISQAAYSVALIPMAGGFLAPVAATLTGAAIAAGNVMASAGGFLSKFADGGVFQNGNVIPFAKGGVVNKPTLFPMANGGTGLMGEAGAEAVMPLKRMSNGKLGVESSGNGQVVNIYNYSGASVETRKTDDSMDIFIRKVNDALNNERTSSGFRSAYSRENQKGVQAV